MSRSILKKHAKNLGEHLVKDIYVIKDNKNLAISHKVCSIYPLLLNDVPGLQDQFDAHINKLISKYEDPAFGREIYLRLSYEGELSSL